MPSVAMAAQLRTLDKQPGIGVIQLQVKYKIGLCRCHLTTSAPLLRRLPTRLAARSLRVSFRIGATTVLASDGRCLRRPIFHGFSPLLTVPNDAEAERLFVSLADGGQVRMPLTKTVFSSRFGMVADRFGVPWTIVVTP